MPDLFHPIAPWFDQHPNPFHPASFCALVRSASSCCFLKVLVAANDSVKFSSKSEPSSRFFGRLKFFALFEYLSLIRYPVGNKGISGSIHGVCSVTKRCLRRRKRGLIDAANAICSTANGICDGRKPRFFDSHSGPRRPSAAKPIERKGLPNRTNRK